MSAPVPDQINAWQEHWRFCVNCFSLFWNNDPNGKKGFCGSPQAQGRGHVAAGWDFYLAADTTNPPGGG